MAYIECHQDAFSGSGFEMLGGHVERQELSMFELIFAYSRRNKYK
jgi:hypothetical protein